MEKVYKHKKTGYIATQLEKDSVIYKYDCGLPLSCYIKQEMLEDSCDWEKVIHKDYEILSFRSHRNRFYNPTIQKDGTYLDAEIMEFDGNGASLEWMLNEDEYYITSVKRLSDGGVFSIKDKITYKLANREVKTIVGIALRNDNIWLETDSERPTYGMDLEYAEKVKEPILTTEDNEDIFEGDDYYYVNKNNFSNHFVSSANKSFDSKKEGMLDFKYKKNAEEYILMNKPLLSLNDLLSVWCSEKDFDAYKNSPMFQNFKNLAKTKL